MTATNNVSHDDSGSKSPETLDDKVNTADESQNEAPNEVIEVDVVSVDSESGIVEVDVIEIEEAQQPSSSTQQPESQQQPDNVQQPNNAQQADNVQQPDNSQQPYSAQQAYNAQQPSSGQQANNPQQPPYNAQQPPYNGQQPPYNAQQPPQGQTYYQQPYAHPVASTKDHVAAGLLAIFLGGLGIHKFYLGYNTAGFIMLAVSVLGSIFTIGIAGAVVWVIGIIEGILYLTKSQGEFEQMYVFNKREWF